MKSGFTAGSVASVASGKFRGDENLGTLTAVLTVE